MYAKLQDGRLLPAPGRVELNGKSVINPSEAVLTSLGYLPVQHTDRPAESDGYYAVDNWVQTGSTILQVWTLVRDTRPLALEEIMSMFLRQQINTLSVDDQTALRMLDYYPTWESLTGTEVAAGTRLTYGGKLYKVLQAHTVSAQWVTGVGTESIYTRIDEEHEGDRYDPIPYEGNMELEQGKYYSQGGVVYLCNRSTGQPVYNTLAELVGLYV